MKQLIIACSMLEDELKQVYSELDCQIPVIWMERGYHDTPELLREKLQQTINEHQDVDEILLVYCLCGNGTQGIYSPGTRLVLPRFDDCINLMLCTGARNTRALTKAGTMYLTHGWSLSEKSMVQQYEQMVEEYDEETAEDLVEMMYGHYTDIALIDTGCYDMEQATAYAKKAGEVLHLDVTTVPGSTKILRELLTGVRNNHFVVCKPGEAISPDMFDILY